MTNIVYIALEYFLVYSFLGWCTEVAYQAVKKGMIINRGFLNGPVCPIYGFGVLAIFRTLEAVGKGDLEEHNAFRVFIVGVILATLIELFGGWILDKIFHARWWDYSDQPFNLHGYICLEFSIIWGLGILLVVRGINPAVMHVLDLIPRKIGWILIVIFSLLFIADVIISVMVMAGLNKRMAEIDEMRERMRVVSNDLSERIGSKALETAQRVDEAKVQTALAKAEAKDQIDLARTEYDIRKAELEQKRRDLIEEVAKSRYFGAGRLLRAFPDMKHRDYEEMIELMKKRLGVDN